MPALPCTKLTLGEQKQLKQYAWQVLAHAVQSHTLALPATPCTPALLKPTASFVSLHLDDQLKGCIGDCAPQQPLWLSVCKNTFSCAFEDLRFSPVTAQDLDQLKLQISVLSELFEVENQGEPALVDYLASDKPGLLLTQGAQGALFLPDVWQSLPEPERFVWALKQKAGWQKHYWHKDIKISVFSTFAFS